MIEGFERMERQDGRTNLQTCSSSHHRRPSHQPTLLVSNESSVHPRSPSPLPPPPLRPAISTPTHRDLSSNDRLELSQTAEAEEREQEGWELESSGGEDKLGFELIDRS